MFFLYFAGTEQIPLKAPFFNNSGTVRIILLNNYNSVYYSRFLNNNTGAKLTKKQETH